MTQKTTFCRSGERRALNDRVSIEYFASITRGFLACADFSVFYTFLCNEHWNFDSTQRNRNARFCFINNMMNNDFLLVGDAARLCPIDLNSIEIGDTVKS